MKIVVRLSNYQYCDGCPCKNNDREDGCECNLGYWEKDRTIGTYGRYEKVEINNNTHTWHYIRPLNCIEDNGE